MTTKICTDCKLDLDISNYYIHNKKRKDGSIFSTYQNLCKQCSSSRRKKYYVDNIDSEKAKRNQRNQNIKDWFIELKKTYKCSICKDSRWYVLDFHHINNDKESGISELVANKQSKTKILNELAKCISLCSNCHREHHYLESLKAR